MQSKKEVTEAENPLNESDVSSRHNRRVVQKMCAGREAAFPGHDLIIPHHLVACMYNRFSSLDERMSPMQSTEKGA